MTDRIHGISTDNAGIYQFALNYGDNTHTTMDCGMLYALLPGNGSVMMVDGSHIFQTSEEFYSGVYDFLKEITGTPDGEKVRISCWFITHSHSDHMAGASGFLRRYHDKVDLERVMFNFPAFAVRPAETAYASQFRHTLRTYYPDVTFLKPHTGMHLDLASMGSASPLRSRERSYLTAGAMGRCSDASRARPRTQG